MLLFCDPPMYGRSAAGVSWTIATHQPDAATIDRRRDAELSDPAAQRHRRGEQIDEPERGHHEERLQHLGEEREPTRVAASTSHLVLPASIARTVAYVAMVSSSTSSASGLSKRNISAATGVSATVAPAISAAAGENHLPDGQVGEADRGDTLECLRHEDAPRVDAEHPRREVHHPERGGRLVNGDEVRRVEGPEEERLPARRASLDGGGVEGVGPSRCAEVPEVEERGDRRAARSATGEPRRRPPGVRGPAAGPSRTGAPRRASLTRGGIAVGRPAMPAGDRRRTGGTPSTSLCRPAAHGDLSGGSEFAVSAATRGAGGPGYR